MQLRTEIDIEAPPDRVWAVLTDFSSYRDWNPFISSVRGKLTEGARLDLELTPPQGRSMTFRSTVVTVDPERELRWKGHYFVKGLFEGEHFFRLEQTECGTRVVHGENFSGMAVKIMGGVLTQMARGFVFMNQALRRRVLSQAG